MLSIPSKDLNRLLGTLPQGLYDEIYNLTFTVDSKVRVITKDWRSPATLQVDRLSRKQFAISYFSGAIFFFPRPCYKCEMVADWLAHLAPEHLKHIKGINLAVERLPSHVTSLESLAGMALEQNYGRPPPGHPVLEVVQKKIGLVWVHEMKAMGVEY